MKAIIFMNDHRMMRITKPADCYNISEYVNGSWQYYGRVWSKESFDLLCERFNDHGYIRLEMDVDE